METGKGAGRYDEECAMVRASVNAISTILIVIKGDRGTGFSVQTLAPSLFERLPALLRELADGIEREHYEAAGDETRDL